MAVVIVKKSASKQPTTPQMNLQSAANINKGHARKLDIQGLDLNTPQRLLVGHVLALMKTSHSTLNRWIESGDFPKPDGKQGRRPFWLSSTVRPLVGE